MHIVRRLPLAAGLALLLVAPLGSCGSDLGEPVLRQADWDATSPDDGGSTNSNNSLADYMPDCGPDYYPCPPYGTFRGDTVENLNMAAANDVAMDFADSSGVFSMADLRTSGAKLLFVFLTAGW